MRDGDAKSFDVKIGERLRARRLLLRIKQGQLGQVLGVSAQQIHKYERGQSSLTAHRIIQLSSALDCPIHYFFEQYDAQLGVPGDVLSLLSETRNISALNLFSELSTDQQGAVLDLLRSMSSRDEGDESETQDRRTA